MAVVPSSVGDGLLGQAVDRGPDRRAKVVELAGERHLNAGPRLAIGGELLDLGHCVANAAAAGNQNKARDMVTEATQAIARIIKT